MSDSEMSPYGFFLMPDDRNVWLERVLPAAEVEQVKELPDEIQEQLYPEVLSFGPGGPSVMKMADDWRARKSNGSEVCNHPEAEALVEQFSDLDMGYFMNFFQAVRTRNLENNLWDVIESFDLNHGKFSLNNEVFFAVFAWAVFEELIDETSGTTRNGRRVLKNGRIAATRLLRLMGLNGADYYTKDFGSKIVPTPKLSSRKVFI